MPRGVGYGISGNWRLSSAYSIASRQESNMAASWICVVVFPYGAAYLSAGAIADGGKCLPVAITKYSPSNSLTRDSGGGTSRLFKSNGTGEAVAGLAVAVAVGAAGLAVRAFCLVMAFRFHLQESPPRKRAKSTRGALTV